MTDVIRFGTLGCGRIVHRGLIPGVTGSPAATLHAVASLRPGVAEDLARQLNAPKAYSTYEALLDDPDVQAVYIPTPGDLHRRWTIAAAEAGKHVLCEKPLATSVAEAEEMIAACREADVVLQEAFMWRHHPRSKQARQMIHSGKIGELRLIVASFSFDIDRGDWRLQPERGGGAMWDVGCYGVNAARYFTGAEPEEIHSRANFYETGVDMTMQLALRFPSDVLANIDCSFEAPFRCHLELVGTKGSLTLPDAFLPPDEAPLVVRRGTADDVEPETIRLPKANQFVEEINDFCASIAAGELQAPAENGLANMRVLERALQTAKANR